MKTREKLIAKLALPPGRKVRLARIDPEGALPPDLAELAEDELKEHAREVLAHYLERLAEAQEQLWADDRRSVLVVLQAMDAAGKDGTIKHVMSGVNPQGCQVHSFKKPSAEELDHDFLWRYVKALPERGRIGIFNRSYYEDVLVVKVHPELLDTGKLPAGKRGKAFWRARYEAINALEKHLVESGTLVLKFFLHISKEEQRRRLLDRLEDPSKHWKFSTADVVERGHWEEYQEAYEDALQATGTPWAPWHVIPANRKHVARTLVAALITRAIEGLDLAWPRVSEAAEEELRVAREQLLGEAPSAGGRRAKKGGKQRKKVRRGARVEDAR
ncbi:MAG: polyphosphate kinase 2 family protein [Planctomycetes bacterium]|nr:polyphosphate kinase 2 family protein [Planctomycetota bacterium]